MFNSHRHLKWLPYKKENVKNHVYYSVRMIRDDTQFHIPGNLSSKYIHFNYFHVPISQICNSWHSLAMASAWWHIRCLINEFVACGIHIAWIVLVLSYFIGIMHLMQPTLTSSRCIKLGIRRMTSFVLKMPTSLLRFMAALAIADNGASGWGGPSSSNLCRYLCIDQ